MQRAAKARGARRPHHPLADGAEELGRIECGPKPDEAFTDEDAEILTTLARQVALVVRSARLAAELSHRLRDMERQAEQLAASRTRIVRAGDAERRRIERDLHDGAQQQLIALMAKLRLARRQLAGDPRIDEVLNELEVDAAEVHRNLVDLVRGIHPPVLSDRGLAEAIESRAQRLPVPVQVLVSPALRARRYPDEVEAATYYLVSEALTNVLKHAKATRVTVRLSESEGRLRVEVTDDGIGFSGAAPGHGLRHMSDRVEALGGTLELAGALTQGTRVSGNLPAGGRRD